MLIDLLTLFATSALAFGAIRISTQANEIAKQSANTALEAVKVEVDKHIFEWGQRCLNCASRVSSLRMLPDGKMKEAAFDEERRLLYAELFALKEEGTLFFEKSQDKATAPCIVALEEAIEHVRHDNFTAPQKGDFKDRQATNNEIRSQIRKFSAAIQTRVGTQWADN